MSDQIIKLGQSVIQHGHENNRVYLMKLSMNDMPNIMYDIDRMVDEHRYTKAFAKIPREAKNFFMGNGYTQEALIPNFYNGCEDGCFMAKFLDEQRTKEKRFNKVKQVIDKALGKKPVQTTLSKEYSMRKATKNDVDQMAEVYKTIFKTYPFPIHEKSYLRQTMGNDVVYFGVWHEKKLVALSSCELDCDQSNAEMTDFATLPEYRGQNLALYLLGRMEEELKQRNIHTAYTIARAYSYGMNITFAKANYTFAGTLTNNTNISGNIESMNIWYKTIM